MAILNILHGDKFALFIRFEIGSYNKKMLGRDTIECLLFIITYYYQPWRCLMTPSFITQYIFRKLAMFSRGF